jgi:hypothetical protein
LGENGNGHQQIRKEQDEKYFRYSSTPQIVRVPAHTFPFQFKHALESGTRKELSNQGKAAK